MHKKDLKIEQMEIQLKKIIDEMKPKSGLKLFKCSLCDFETNSESGLKIHSKKKHTKLDKEVYPRLCDLCDKTCKNSHEMKKHLITHSYKEANYKCSDCDFVSEHIISMEVHIGKCHSENYDCGICSFEAGSLENLETHLRTCEVYQCDECEKRIKSIAEIKEHITNIHDREAWWINHLKMDRNTSSEINEKNVIFQANFR